MEEAKIYCNMRRENPNHREAAVKSDTRVGPTWVFPLRKDFKSLLFDCSRFDKVDIWVILVGPNNKIQFLNQGFPLKFHAVVKKTLQPTKSRRGRTSWPDYAASFRHFFPFQSTKHVWKVNLHQQTPITESFNRCDVFAVIFHINLNCRPLTLRYHSLKQSSECPRRICRFFQTQTLVFWPLGLLSRAARVHSSSTVSCCWC